MTQTSTPPSTHADAPSGRLRAMAARVTPLEVAIAAVIAVVMIVLVVIEPEIVEAPFENLRTMLFTIGGTVVAAAALVAMLAARVPPGVRIIALLVPFVVVNWWLLSPYFVDTAVDEQFATSISSQLSTIGASTEPAAGATDSVAAAQAADAETPASPSGAAAQTADAAGLAAAPEGDEAGTEAGAAVDTAPPAQAEPEPEPTGPVLVGAGSFAGLAGHSGTGDAGLFENPDGSFVLRFENFDIQNGPDLEVYLVPGADQVSLADGSIHLGALKGNVGDQNYELPAGTQLAPGPYTALVWCEAFSVEFVGATITVG